MKSGPLIALLLMVLLPGYALFASGGEAGYVYAFSVRENSWVSINGSTNINRFACLSESETPRGYIMAEPRPGSQAMLFTDALMGLRIGSFDCRNKVMNQDFRKALGGHKHPNIDIRLLESIDLHPSNLTRQGGRLKTKVEITINGKKRITDVMVDWKQTQGFLYQFSGSKQLKMSDFGIDPPSPALGLVRVHDEIEIRFNLLIEAGQIAEIPR